MAQRKKNPSESSPAAELRRKAEGRLRTRKANPAGAVADADLRALVHELQVHQIELEMQNEELCRARAAAQESSEHNWSITFDAMVDGVSLHGPDHTIIDVNQSLCQMLGTTKEEMLGKKCYQVFHGKNTPITGCPLEISKETCRKEYAELFEPSLSRWLAVSSSPIVDDAGCLLNVVHVVRDITDRKRAEAALRTSEARYRKLFEDATEGIALADAESGTILDCNQAFLQLSGYDRLELIGRPQVVLHPAEPGNPVVSHGFAKRRDSRDGTIHSTELLTKAGALRQVEIKANVLQIDGRRVMLGFFRDVTSETRYRSLFENMLNGVAHCRMLFDHGRPQDFIFLAVNNAFETLTGLKDVAGKRVSEVIPGIGEDDPGLLEIYGRVAMTGVPEKFETYVNALGMWFTVSVYRAGNEEFVHVFDVITERKRSEERQARMLKRLKSVNQLQEKLLLPGRLEEKARQITAAAVKLLDLDFCRIWIAKPGDLCDRGCIHATATQERDACRHRDRCMHLITSTRRYTHTGGSYRRVPFGYHKVRWGSGDEKGFLTNTLTVDPQMADHAWAERLGLVSFIGCKLEDAGGRPLGVLAAFAKHSISEEDRTFLSNLAETTSKVILDSEAEEELREQRKRAEAANRAKSEFLANMSHEIRTPMTAILGFSDLLAAPNLPHKERRDFLEAIRRNGTALLELINDILDLSRIEADKLVLERTHYPLRQAVDDVLSTVKVQAEDKDLGLEVDYEFPLPESIHTDPMRLHQVLVNLVGNAVKFTERGVVRIAVRSMREDQEALRVQFAVSDTGIGIPADKIGRLFRPFTQADGSATRRFGGTGLGLAISKRLAKALGGDIEVVSEPGAGSTFTLTIDAGPRQGVPMLQSPPAAVAASKEPPPARQEAPLHGRVLLAEDVPDVQLVLLKVLRQLNLEVEFAEDGLAACRSAKKSKLEGRPFDLILMDIQMPEMNGYEAAHWLRRHGWKGPIVALTAHAMVGDREKCLSAGCDDYLSKPVHVKALRDVLARYLGRPAIAAGNEDRAPAAAAAGPVGLLEAGPLDAATVARLVGGFAQELPARAMTIRSALRSHDLPSVKELAHQLKGSAGLYGFTRIADTARVIHQRATEEDDLKRLRAAVNELVELCEQARTGQLNSRT